MSSKRHPDERLAMPTGDPATLAAQIGARVNALITNELTKLKSPAVRAVVAHELVDKLGAVAATARAIRADAIKALRDNGIAWDGIGDALGVSPQRAQQLSTVQLTDQIGEQ